MSAPHRPGDDSLDWRQVRRENHRAILKALADVNGSPMYDSVLRVHVTDCPKCGSGLQVFDPDECPNSLLRCSGCGLDEIAFFRALGGTPDGVDPHELLVDMHKAKEAAASGFEYPLSPLAACGVLTVLVGKYSSRKTWLCLLGGHAVHSGEAAIAGLTCTQTPVLYVDAENGSRIMGKRFDDAGIPEDGLLVGDGLALTPLPKNVERLRALIQATRARLVVLDSLRRLTPGVRENDSDDMAPVMGALAKLARDTDAAIVLIHHRSSKDGSARVRGSSAIEDQADLLFELEHMSRGLCALRCRKYRIDEEPGTLWLRIAADLAAGGTMTLSAAQPFPDDEDQAAPPTVPNVLVQTIEKLGDQVTADGGWPPGKLARAVGREQDDGSFKTAVGELLESGQWEASGQGPARRLKPGNRANPLRDRPVARFGEQGGNGRVPDDELPDGDSIDQIVGEGDSP